MDICFCVANFIINALFYKREEPFYWPVADRNNSRSVGIMVEDPEEGETAAQFTEEEIPGAPFYLRRRIRRRRPYNRIRRGKLIEYGPRDLVYWPKFFRYRTMQVIKKIIRVYYGPTPRFKLSMPAIKRLRIMAPRRLYYALTAARLYIVYA
jgi:hypothetical protein